MYYYRGFASIVLKKKYMSGITLKKFIQNRLKIKKRETYRPRIFNLRRSADQKELLKLVKVRKIFEVIDNFAEDRKELIEMGGTVTSGVWVYYPWNHALVHILSSKSYGMVRTSRNHNLILPQEQEKFASIKVGIAGLNVGNPAALCLALEGGANFMKFADNDTLSLSNLNRFHAGVTDLGINKAVLSARQVYEINPFASVEAWLEGISEERIDEFLLNPKIDILIEEMDNLKLKIAIRERARAHKIPVLMVTGNGENVIMDVERFDLNPKLSLLNGKLKGEVLKKIYSFRPDKGTIKDKVLLARDFMGASILTKRLRQSFHLVGSSLVGIPQLAESSFLRGAVLCYFVRQIAVGKKVPSGRYEFRLDSLSHT